MTEIAFDKYDRKGAYHWVDYYGGVLRMNAYTRARYELVTDCVGSCLNGGRSRRAKVLDLGCGDGALASVLQRQLGVAIVGVDTSRQGIELARQQFAEHDLAGEFRQVEGYETGAADGEFDVVVCSEVIEHVGDPKRLLLEIARVLAPGGFTVLTTPIRVSEQPLDPMHVQEWFVNEFVALCASIFGAPVRVIRSHPLVWYELVTAKSLSINRVSRFTANVLTRFGRNPFREAASGWRSYTTQTVVLRKPAVAGS